LIELRPFDKLGRANHGWLDARHHFSFANYYNPDRMNWGNLRVWNDDRIAPGTGFPLRSHRDMEIVTCVREGALTHYDDLGNQGRTEAGDVQVMSAGTGITHAEYNREAVDTRIFQIWIIPDTIGEKPAWGTRAFPRADRSGRFTILASGFAEDGEALPIRAEARVAGICLKAGETVEYRLGESRKGYLVPATGAIEIEGIRARAGDGVAIADTDTITITACEDSDIILVDAV
jgi:redox-sensitive bicupin YhaK (pirin superfamily)